jgi:uncharacterized protein (DUF1778 family)
MMKHQVVGDTAVVVVTAKELQELLEAIENPDPPKDKPT